MKLKKFQFLLTLVFVFTIALSPILVLAVQLDNPLGDGVTFESTVKNVITGVLGVSGILALIAFILGGITWMTSGGESAKIQKGKNMMVWAVMGIVIIFSAYSILSLIFTTLGGGSGGATRVGETTQIINPATGYDDFTY